MTKIFQRYLAFNFIPPFVLSTLFFVLFLLTFQLFKVVRIVINKGVEAQTVLEIVGHMAITFLPLAIPLSALFATIYTLNKLSEDSEIVAMRAFGVAKHGLLAPFLILGLLIALVIFSLNRKVIPYSKTQFKNTIIRLTSRGMLTNIKSEQFFTDIPGVTLFAEKVSSDGKHLESVFIRKIEKSSEKVIVAKVGDLIKKQASKWELPTLRLHLLEGNITTTFFNKSRVEKILFEKYDFPIMQGGSLSSFVSKDSMKTNYQLLKKIDKEKEKLKVAKSAGGKKSITKSLSKAQLEYWSRFNTPLQTLIFIFLGFGLGIKKGRGKGKNSSVTGFAVLILYYTIFFLGVSLANRGYIPASFTIFLPSALALGAASYLYRKLDWN